MRNGQITVLVLLLALMGLTVGLSQVSRSLSDLKQVTYVDSGTKAFAAAESGMQYALNQLSNGAADCISHPVTPLPTGINAITYTICPLSVSNSAVFSNVTSDNTIQIDLSKISAGTTGVDVLWSGDANAGLEVIEIDNLNVISRYAYSPTTTNNGFTSTGSCTCPGLGSYNYCASSIPVANTHKLLRIKPLLGAASAANIAVCARGTSPTIGSTGYMVTVTAASANNSQKKLQTIKYVSSLPSVFDFAMYSGTGINKN